VDDAVAERRGADQPPLGFGAVKAAIRPGPVRAAAQLVLELEQLLLQPVLEANHVRQAALALARGAKGPEEIFKRAKFVV